MAENTETGKTKTVRKWEELWDIGRAAGCTHWNYSRGRLRFRTLTDDPVEIGQESEIDSREPVRVRFFEKKDKEFVCREDVEVLFLSPRADDSDLPEFFDNWSHRKQEEYLMVKLQKISADRYAKQMDGADRILFRYIEFLQDSLKDREKEVKELREKNNKLIENHRGVNNIYEFLVHQNTQTILPVLAHALALGSQSAMQAIVSSYGVPPTTDTPDPPKSST